MPPVEKTVGTGAQGALRSDIRGDHWLLRALPDALKPYGRLARLDRPIGTWLLLLPGWWSLLLASEAGGGALPLWYLLLFAAGALLMRGAGCTINDLFDRDIDAQVARTATRPLPSGEVTPRQALLFLALLLSVSLVILLQFNVNAVLLGALSLALVVPYPLMKRITYWPQAWLGLTFNWGALLGWTAVTGGLAWPPLLLYVGGIAWTLGYDTIYAHQDKEDDALIGVKSTALKLAGQTRGWVLGFFALASVLWLGAGLAAGVSWPFFAGLAAMGLHFLWQVATLDIDDPDNCIRRFRSNRDAGLLLFLGLLLAHAGL